MDDFRPNVDNSNCDDYCIVFSIKDTIEIKRTKPGEDLINIHWLNTYIVNDSKFVTTIQTLAPSHSLAITILLFAEFDSVWF